MALLESLLAVLLLLFLCVVVLGIIFFFFQAEDGIRDKLVTGVQTCALPICVTFAMREIEPHCQTFISTNEINFFDHAVSQPATSFGKICVLTEADVFGPKEIGRASCRERV